MDSILKNIGDPYKTKFQSTLIADFKVVFTKLDIDGRRAVYKLRTTWNSLYSLIKLHELDNVMQRDLDANWPVVPLPSHLQDKTSKPSITYTNPKIKTEAMKPSSSIKEKLTAEKKVLEMQKQLAEKEKQIQKLQRENQRRSTPVEDLGIVREKDKKKKKKKEKKSQPDNLMQQDLSDYRKGKIVEKTVEARYTKTVQHRPDPRLKSLPRVDPKQLQMDEITPKTGQLLQSLGKKDQQVFTIPAASKVKHIPVADAVKNASKEKLYLHARNLFTTNKITKDQYDNLINTIKVMKDAADQQLANGDKKAPLIVPFKDIRGGDATIKAEIDVDVDEPITDQKRREDRERERKEKYKTNDPLSMNVSDSDDSDEITEITPSGAVARKLVREKLQRDKRDKNDKSGKRTKP